MQKLLSLLLILALSTSLSACATMGTTTTTGVNIDQILATAKRIDSTTGVLLDNVGPLVVASVCITQPQDCAAAKTALTLAQGTHKEITALIAAAEAAHAVPDGTKLATLAQSFMSEIGDINTLIVAYGGKPVDLSGFSTALAELKNQKATNL